MHGKPQFLQSLPPLSLVFADHPSHDRLLPSKELLSPSLLAKGIEHPRRHIREVLVGAELVGAASPAFAPLETVIRPRASPVARPPTFYHGPLPRERIAVRLKKPF